MHEVHTIDTSIRLALLIVRGCITGCTTFAVRVVGWDTCCLEAHISAPVDTYPAAGIDVHSSRLLHDSTRSSTCPMPSYHGSQECTTIIHLVIATLSPTPGYSKVLPLPPIPATGTSITQFSPCTQCTRKYQGTGYPLFHAGIPGIVSFGNSPVTIQLITAVLPTKNAGETRFKSFVRRF